MTETTFTADQKKDLEPLARRIGQWNAALDDIAEDCACRTLEAGQVLTVPECPGAPQHCLGRSVAAIRISMNLFRMEHTNLSDADLIDSVRALSNVFAGLQDATSHTRFANDILLALRQPEHFVDDTTAGTS